MPDFVQFCPKIEKLGRFWFTIPISEPIKMLYFRLLKKIIITKWVGRGVRIPFLSGGPTFKSRFSSQLRLIGGFSFFKMG